MNTKIPPSKDKISERGKGFFQNPTGWIDVIAWQAVRRRDLAVLNHEGLYIYILY